LKRSPTWPGHLFSRLHAKLIVQKKRRKEYAAQTKEHADYIHREMLDGIAANTPFDVFFAERKAAGEVQQKEAAEAQRKAAGATPTK